MPRSPNGNGLDTLQTAGNQARQRRAAEEAHDAAGTALNISNDGEARSMDARDTSLSHEETASWKLMMTAVGDGARA